jgi:hypothetical protein
MARIKMLHVKVVLLTPGLKILFSHSFEIFIDQDMKWMKNDSVCCVGLTN